MDQKAISANAGLSHGNGIVESAASSTFGRNGVYMMCAALKQNSMEVRFEFSRTTRQRHFSISTQMFGYQSQTSDNFLIIACALR
jgi:hypothetical protein